MHQKKINEPFDGPELPDVLIMNADSLMPSISIGLNQFILQFNFDHKLIVLPQ